MKMNDKKRLNVIFINRCPHCNGCTTTEIELDCKTEIFTTTCEYCEGIFQIKYGIAILAKVFLDDAETQITSHGRIEEHQTEKESDKNA